MVGDAIPAASPGALRRLTSRNWPIPAFPLLAGFTKNTRRRLRTRCGDGLLLPSLAMDYLWTPWRYAYVTGAEKSTGCIFCSAPQAADDEKVKIVHRGEHCFVILNTFPYTPGHVMVVPYQHLDELQKLPSEAAQEMMSLSQKMEGVLRTEYHPDGVNLGMNIGKAAGAGVAGHIHMHILPRWVADANFVSVIGETRMLPETLEVTWQKLKAALKS